MLVALIILQVLDLVTTVVALRNPGLTEGSKFKVIQWFMAHMGVLPALLLLKGAFIGWLCYWRADLPDWTLVALLAGYAYIVFNNFKLIRSH
jgi:hypothetical protein